MGGFRGYPSDLGAEAVEPLGSAEASGLSSHPAPSFESFPPWPSPVFPRWERMMALPWGPVLQFLGFGGISIGAVVAMVLHSEHFCRWFLVPGRGGVFLTLSSLCVCGFA